jgi:WD40 repeat protein
MKNKSKSQSGFFGPGILILLVLLTAGVLVALVTALGAEQTCRVQANPPKLSVGLHDAVIPLGGSWVTTGSLIAARGENTAALLPSGKVIVAGGVGENASQSAELYDPVSESWTATGSLNVARALHTATLLPNGKVLVAGGFDFVNGLREQVARVELYDPITGRWSDTGSLNERREAHGATLLPDGTVLVAGGSNNREVFLASAELYDPASGTWTFTGPMTASRSQFTLTLLPNGQVLAAGGYTLNNILKSAELYDPATGIFTRTGDMNDRRAVHTATLLTTGKVLVAGGYPGFLASAELYDSGIEPSQRLNGQTDTH